MQTATDLRNLLARIDRKGYPAYKDTKGAYQFPDYVLSIDHVQGDPFGRPLQSQYSREGKRRGFSSVPLPNPCSTDRASGCADPSVRPAGGSRTFRAKGSGHSGQISVSRCGQEVLERTACCLDPTHGDLCLRLEVGFPAQGRTIQAPGTGKNSI